MRNCDDPDPAKRSYFNQPVLQTAQMFVGEMGCWLVVGLMSLWQRFVAKSSSRGGYEAVSSNDREVDDDAGEASTSLMDDHDGSPKKPTDQPALRGRLLLLLALPAICDICGTTLMNVGLMLVAASIYQMTRGALVLFVGLFSVVFLRRRLRLFQWLSLVGVVLGVAVVGLAGVIYHEKDAVKSHAMVKAALDSSALLSIVGVLLIAGAQIFTATQFVLEEYILERWAIEPIKVVGWEGIFGFVVTVLGMVVLQLAVGQNDGGRFDMVEGWRQMTTIREIGLSSFLIMISIG